MHVARRPSEVHVREIVAKSVLNRVRNMPFAWSVNPYTGCAHQCVFCYARGTHAYRDLDGVAAWGSEIGVKVNAAAIIRRELAHHHWRNDEVAVGTATDPYQAIEGRYRVTRGVLVELARARTPMHLITRSGLIVRDIDVLTGYAARAPISVCISLPTIDERLARELEPTVAPPRKRLEALARLAAAGIRVGVGVAPVLPGLTDTPAQLAAVVRAAADAGASFAWHGVLNLGEVTRDAFFSYLSDQQPQLVARYRAMYRTRFAPAPYVRDARAAFDAAVAPIRFAPPVPPIVAPPEPAPLTLFGRDVDRSGDSATGTKVTPC